MGVSLNPASRATRVAVHEAGHAVVAEHCGVRVEFIQVDNFQDGHTEIVDSEVPLDGSAPIDYYRSQILIALAGDTAVAAMFGDSIAATERRGTARAVDADESRADESARCVAELSGLEAEVVLSAAREELAQILGTQHVLAVGAGNSAAAADVRIRQWPRPSRAALYRSPSRLSRPPDSGRPADLTLERPPRSARISLSFSVSLRRPSRRRSGRLNA